MTEKRINCDDGIERSLAEALKWYRRIAEENTVAPTFMIGGCMPGIGLWDGFIIDVICQTDENDVYGMARRGYAYEHGMAGVEQDKKEAVAWYQKAAEAGDAYSMFALGNAYAEGEGIDQDEGKRWNGIAKQPVQGLNAHASIRWS